ncbi:hypothetical protein BH23ACT5_BH23ACT5_19170 [soil metagenome]
MRLRIPDYHGTGLVNLIAEIEVRLSGWAGMPGLAEPTLIPDAGGYVLAIFDGLGVHQLGIAEASPLGAGLATVLTAGFPTTTTTSLATVATGQPPSVHGVIGHLLHLPGVAELVNVLKWMTPEGRPVRHDYASMLPTPNLWERLRNAGIEPITVQPGAFLDSPLSTMLYRGCRFEAIWSTEELVTATVELAAPGRLVVPYYPSVDVAAHVSGQSSVAYRRAIAEAATIWEAISARLRPDVGLVATSDHGHLDYPPETRDIIRDPHFAPLRFFGDPRSTFVAGPESLAHQLADSTGALLVDPATFTSWLGPGLPHPDLSGRLPDWVLMAAPGRLLLPRPFDRRLIGYHGGLEPEEVEIPLLVRR